jgi:hypothetical protein
VTWTVWAKLRARPDANGNNAGESGLHVEPERLSFGERWEDAQFPWTLPIENRTDKDIEISGFSSSCTCTAIQPQALVIPARQTREIRLTLDLTAKKQEDAEKGVWDFEVAIQPQVAALAGKRPPEWRLKGRVKAAIRLPYRLLELGRYSEYAQPIPPRTVPIVSSVPLDDLHVSGELPSFPVKVRRGVADPASFELDIEPKPGLPIGTYSFDLTLVPEPRGGGTLPEKRLRVRAEVVSDIQPSASQLLLGAAAVGETVEDVVSLSSLTGAGFEVRDWRCSDTALTVERMKGSDPGSPTFRVRQRVGGPGPHQEVITFVVVPTSGARPAGAIEVVLPVCYHGIDPASKE